jgi:hypothetical protein
MLFLHYYFWITSVGLCVVALFLAYRSKRLKTLPLFFTLLAWYVVVFLVQFPLRNVQSDSLWNWSTFVLLEISFALETAVLYELARTLTFSHPLMAKLLSPLPGRIVPFLVLLATLVSALTPATSQNAVFRVLERLSLAQNFIEVGLLLGLVLFSRALGVSWRSLPAGVALGFGVTASVGIAAMFLQSRLGNSVNFAMDTLRLAGSHVCILVWLWYIVHREPALKSSISCTVIADLSRQAEEFHGILRG